MEWWREERTPSAEEPDPAGPWRAQAVIQLAKGDRFTDMPPCRLFSNTHIMPFMLILISRARKYIYAKQYRMDHSEAFSLLEAAIRRNVWIRIVHDRDKFNNPACAHQNDRIRTLAELARDTGQEDCLRIRLLKPSRFGDGGFNSQHSKTWIVDGEIYVDGSANLTGQSTKNQESILMTREKSVLEDALAVFGEAWGEAEEVSYDRLLSLPEHRSRSFSFHRRRSASVSASRSLKEG